MTPDIAALRLKAKKSGYVNRAEATALLDALEAITVDRDVNSELLSSTIRLKDEIAAQRDKAEADRDSLRAQLATAEASTGAKHEALEVARDCIARWKLADEGFPKTWAARFSTKGTRDEVIADALKLDAGISLLAERDRLKEALGMSTPWPVVDILEKLSDSVKHLLEHHDCDCHGWETRRAAMQAADEMRPKIGAALAPVKP